MFATRHPVLTSGLAIGVLFLANASINNSRSWPMIWPLLGGALAVVLAARTRTVRWGAGIGFGAKAGLVALVVIVAAGTPLMSAIAGRTLEQRLGGALPVPGVLLPIAIMLFLGLLNAAVAAVGGLLAVPFARARHAA